jgi:hypothetical protein
MIPETTWLRWLIAISCAFLLASSLSLLHAGEDNAVRFFFSSDPEWKLLVAESLGAATGLGTSYTLYADGRLEIHEINYKLENIGTSLVHDLTHEEASALVQDVVGAGLLEWNEEQIQREMRQAGGSPYIVSDGATLRLRIDLKNYRRPGKEDFEPASVKIVFKNPTIVAVRYPQVEEIQSLAAVAIKLRSYKQIAAEVDNDE